MADWNNPLTTSDYDDVLTMLKDIIKHSAQMDYAGDTNIPTGAIRLNLVSGRFENWDGSAWVEQALAYTRKDAVETITAAWEFTAAPKTDTISEKTAAAGVTVDGVLLKDSQVNTDQINEKTAAAGVLVDQLVKIKDGAITTATSDGSDNQALNLCGGGAPLNSRGARLILQGNEGGAGAYLDSGSISGGSIILRPLETEVFRVHADYINTTKPIRIVSSASEPSNDASRSQLWYGSGGRPRWKDANNYNHFQRYTFTPANPTVSAGTITGGGKNGEYALCGDVCAFAMQFTNWTLSSAATIYVTLPFTPVGGIRICFSCDLYNGSWQTGRGHYDGSGTTVELLYFNATQMGSGSGKWFTVNGTFLI